MHTVDEIIRASARVLRVGSIPLREPSNARPTFWSPVLTHTRTRPVPAASGWIDYITLNPGVGRFSKGYSAIVNYVIATGKTSMATSGLKYRFLLEGDLLPAQYYNLITGYDLNVERVGTTHPFPAQPRRTYIVVPNNNHLSLQVNNTGVTSQIAYAGFFGWYYPNLKNDDKATFEASGFDQDDTTRGSNAE